MPQKCSICHHPNRLEIERAIIDGVPLRTISGRFGPSKTAIARHRTHVAGAIAHTIESQGLTRAATLLEDIQVGRDRAENLYQLAENILNSALERNDNLTAIGAIRSAVVVLKEARSYLELCGQISGELRQPSASQVTIVLPDVSKQGPSTPYPVIDLALPRR